MYISMPCTAHNILQHVHRTHGRNLISQLAVANILDNYVVIAIFTAMPILYVAVLHAPVLILFGMHNQFFSTLHGHTLFYSFAVFGGGSYLKAQQLAQLRKGILLLKCQP